MATRTKSTSISSIIAASNKEFGISAADVTKGAGVVSDVGGLQAGLGTATSKLRVYLKDRKSLIKTKEGNRALQDAVFFALNIVVFTLSEDGERIQSREYVVNGTNNGQSLYETWRGVRKELVGGDNTEEPVTTLPRGVANDLPAAIAGGRFEYASISRRGRTITVKYTEPK